MNWERLLSSMRFGMEEYHAENRHDRTEYQRDYDRLIFSSPFRRLQNKTQVFPLPGSVFVHNRLTHSLEVSSVGRSLGENIGRGIRMKYPASPAHFGGHRFRCLPGARFRKPAFRTLGRESHFHLLLRRERPGVAKTSECRRGKMDRFYLFRRERQCHPFADASV
jgi:hypothetical protein